MNNIILRMSIILVAVAVIAGGLLAIVNSFAEPLVRANQEQKIREAVFEVLPAARDFRRVEKEGLVYFRGSDDSGNEVGLALLSVGNGWGSEITLMVGLDNDLKRLTGMTVLDQRETPGLGDKISRPDFQQQFQGRTVDPELVLLRNEEPTKTNEVEAITGATISSTAVVKIMNRDLKALKGLRDRGDL